MYKFVILVVLLLLSVNGFLAWQSWKTTAKPAGDDGQITCSIRPDDVKKTPFLMPGSLVEFN